jgi:hypothetical protein
MSDDQPINIDAVIADLEVKKAAIENAIQALKALYPTGGDASLSAILGPVSPTGGSATVAVAPENIPDGAFFGMRSIAEAAKKYLGLVKRKQTTKQIVEALERGGFPHQSKKLYSTVYTSLQREEEREGGELVRIGSEWAIASWYPGHARRAKQETEPKKGTKKGKKANPRAAKQPKALLPAPTPRGVPREPVPIVKAAGG